MKLFMLGILGIMFSSNMSDNQSALGWRGLVPMKSSCEEVKRVLPSATCKGAAEEFDLGSERVRISYSGKPCHKAYQEYWDIPVGTVILIERDLTPSVPLAELQIDLAECEGFTFHGSRHYSCREKGIELTTSDTSETSDVYVSDIKYLPTPADARLRCRAPHKNQGSKRQAAREGRT